MEASPEAAVEHGDEAIQLLHAEGAIRAAIFYDRDVQRASMLGAKRLSDNLYGLNPPLLGPGRNP